MERDFNNRIRKTHEDVSVLFYIHWFIYQRFMKEAIYGQHKLIQTEKKVKRTRSTVQYSTVQYSTVQYSTVQYSTVQYSTQYTVQYSTVQYTVHSTVQYSTVPATSPHVLECIFALLSIPFNSSFKLVGWAKGVIQILATNVHVSFENRQRFHLWLFQDVHGALKILESPWICKKIIQAWKVTGPWKSWDFFPLCW
jgi:hypothetical protein